MLNEVVDFILYWYNSILNSFSGSYADGVRVIFLGIVILLSSLFIWFFYRSLSNKDIIKLKLNKYNRSEHPVFSKVFAILFYILEYIIILPFVLFLWTSALAIFILLITPEKAISEVLLISCALVLVIRFLAYYNRELSKDLSKLFPFITLSIFLLSTNVSVVEIFTKLKEIPLLINTIFSYLIVIFVLEIFLRIIYTIFLFWWSEDARGNN